jgi:hypothetical protein
MGARLYCAACQRRWLAFENLAALIDSDAAGRLEFQFK